jgi:transcriptional regulator GlxA family with amidase domain
MTQTVEIGIVIYPNAQEAAVLGLEDMFEIADGIAGDAPRRLLASRWHLDESSGELVRLGTVERGKAPFALLVPPSKGPPIPHEIGQRYGGPFRSFHSAGGTLASVCGGSFLLAEAGLLEGRTATTHFAFQEAFRQRFPKVKLAIDRLIVDDVDIITAGGMMAWMDLGLKLVDRYLGSTVMLETARTLLIDPPGREQSYYGSFVPPLNHGDASVLAAQHWIHSAFANEITVGALADKAGLGERTFLRRFSKATAMTSTDYLQQVRVNKAREVLQFSQTSVDQVAWDVGYSDTSAFRKVFQRIVGLTPNDYRRRFHV